jgi:ornithine carbamoyltransferase
VLSDLYAFSKLRGDYLKANYLFVGATGNIGLGWKEAAQLLGLNLKQSCPKGYEMEDVEVITDLDNTMFGQDIILTDPLPSDIKSAFVNHMVTLERMKKANDNALLNPCPPFARGEEVSADVIDSEYFVGYGFKKHLLAVQQAIILYCHGIKG